VLDDDCRNTNNIIVSRKERSCQTTPRIVAANDTAKTIHLLIIFDNGVVAEQQRCFGTILWRLFKYIAFWHSFYY
jgi:hypothetical protein